ncbi:exported hypothetical protein [Nocardioides sp. AX2bis]|nr:exported hypothetical protein [Nocardioides sp. AX2bis]
MRPVWGRGRWHCLALGAACAAVTLVPLATEGGPADSGTTASLPHQLAGYSYLTTDVSEAPPGRAIALYQHGFGVEFLDFPQAVVLGADTDIYRRLDAAEDRAGPETQGDPAPMLLSPDGRRVALGDHDTSEADLEIVDLSSADVARHALPPARSVRPIAWSSESTQVAYISSTEPTNPYSGRSLVGDLVVLDTDSGDTTAVTVGDPISGAAFSPDGSLIAVQRRGSSSGISLVDLATSTVRDLPRPLQDEAQRGVLAGPEAWSPDGRLLAVAHEESMEFLDVTGCRPQPPLHLTGP